MSQLPFLTYVDTTKSAVEYIKNLLKHAIPCAPPFITTPNHTPTPEQTIPESRKTPMNVNTTSPTMPTVLVQVQRVPIVIPDRPPVQVQRVPLKYPGGETIPVRKAMPMQPAFPSLHTWRHDPDLRHTCAAVVAQLVIQ